MCCAVHLNQSLTGLSSAQVGSAYKSRTGRVVGHIAVYGHDPACVGVKEEVLGHWHDVSAP